ncbi:hypothetical protein HMPREF0022_03926, partial [Acinetobacter baumannii 6014059]
MWSYSSLTSLPTCAGMSSGWLFLIEEIIKSKKPIKYIKTYCFTYSL